MTGFTPVQVLSVNDDLPVRTVAPVHSGKVRSAYWLTSADSRRLIRQRAYPVPDNTALGLMVISDRLSAFDCVWRAEGGLDGVPGKGAALNAISSFWFAQFRAAGLGANHILETPHPLLWVVQRAQPVRIEAIARRYITGSLWRAYAAGERYFCGNQLPDGLHKDQRLPELLLTPSTKGILRGLEGVPEADDANIDRSAIERHWAGFGFRSAEDIARYEQLLTEGFAVISQHMAKLGKVFVDTKFEFGYVDDSAGQAQLIYMDEVGTPDSSRIWEADAYARGHTVEQSKEQFRQQLLSLVPDADLLLNKSRMAERTAFADATRLPASMLLGVSDTYRELAERITAQPLAAVDRPRDALLEVLGGELDLLQ